MYLGEYEIDEYIDLVATTHRFSSGANYAATSIKYRVYEDGSNAQIIDDTDMTNFDSITGLYYNRVQLTTATGFEVGKSYVVLIQATVDNVTSIDWRSFKVKATITATLDTVKADTVEILTRVPDATAGEAGGLAIVGSEMDLVNAPNTTAVSAFVVAIWAALTSGLTAAGSIGKKLADWIVGTIDTYTGNTKQTGDAYARLGAPTGASVSADVAAVKAETAAILEDTGTTLDGKLNTIDDFLDTEIAAILDDTNELQTDWHNGGRLDLILDAAGAAGDPWLTALPGAYGAGTAGKIVGDNINAPIGTIDTVVDAIKAKTDNIPASPATEAKQDTVIAYLDTEVAAILADTNELQADWANGGRLDLLVDGVKAKTDSLTFTVAGDVDCNVQTWKGGAAPDMTGDAYGILNNVTYGNSALKTLIDALSGATGVSVSKILNTALTETDAGYLAAAFKKLFDVLTPVLTCESVNQNQDNATTAEIKTALEAAGSSLALILEDTGTTLDTLVKDIPTNAELATALDPLPTAAEIADAVHDEVVESTLTFRQMLRIFMSVLTGKSSGGGTTTIIFQDIADTKARITATVDADGNRTNIVTDGE